MKNYTDGRSDRAEGNLQRVLILISVLQSPATSLEARDRQQPLGSNVRDVADTKVE